MNPIQRTINIIRGLTSLEIAMTEQYIEDTTYMVEPWENSTEPRNNFVNTDNQYHGYYTSGGTNNTYRNRK